MFELKIVNQSVARAPSALFPARVNDWVWGLVADLCEELDESSSAEFVVSGFGQPVWPLDIGTDLLTFLEQLAVAIAACRKAEAFEIDLYEQGTERCLSFVPHSGQFCVSCASGTDWQPCPQVEEIGRNRLEAELVQVRGAFLELIRTIARTSEYEEVAAALGA